MGSDDFSQFLEWIPGCYYFLNYIDERGYIPIHSPLYIFNDKIISSGALIYSKIVEKRLGVNLLV